MAIKPTDLVTSPAALEVQDALAQWLDEQPWYRRYANTVTQVATGATVLVWWVLTSGIEMTTWVQYGVGAVLFLGGVVRTKQTRNGMTPSTAAAVTARVEQYADRPPTGRHARPVE
jgi:hypothetical protein